MNEHRSASRMQGPLAWRESVKPPDIVQDPTRAMELANGSRIVALPGTEHTIRSFSALRLILVLAICLAIFGKTQPRAPGPVKVHFPT